MIAMFVLDFWKPQKVTYVTWAVDTNIVVFLSLSIFDDFQPHFIFTTNATCQKLAFSCHVIC
jgi:hypothetical protein